MKLPRDLSGAQLAKHLGRVGYPLKIGTLGAILGEVATHLRLSREELLERLFG